MPPAMRRLVKLPGPAPQTTRSTASTSTLGVLQRVGDRRHQPLLVAPFIAVACSASTVRRRSTRDVAVVRRGVEGERDHAWPPA